MATEHYLLSTPSRDAVPEENVDDAIDLFIAACHQIDGILKTHADAIALKSNSGHDHGISGIVGLVEALANKMAADKTFRIGELSDVVGADAAPAGYVLVKGPDQWSVMSAAAAIGNHQHTTDDIEGLSEAIEAGLKVVSVAGLAGSISALALKAALAINVADVAGLDMVALGGNLIVNGAFQHSQQNGNVASGVDSYYVADEWAVLRTSSPGVTSAQRVQSTTPYGSLDRARISIGVADATISAGEFLCFRHAIEGTKVAHLKWGTAAAKPLLMRFGFKGPAGTYAVSAMNSAANRCYVREFTVGVGQANTDTEQTLIFPGDTSGVWLTNTGVGINVRIALAVGSTYQTTANAWQAGNFMGTASTSNGMGSSNIFELFDVGAYADIFSLGVFPRYVKPDFERELIRCQRYFQTHVIYLVSSAYAAGAYHGETLTFPVVMRALPSNLDAGGGSSSNASTFGVDGTSSPKSARVYMISGATGYYGVSDRNVHLNARL